MNTLDILTGLYNLNYDKEMGVLFHWSEKRGWVPLSERKNKNVSYYLFKHEGKTTYISKSVVVDAFTNKQKMTATRSRQLVKILARQGDSCKLSTEEFITAMEGIENAKEHEDKKRN